MSFILCSLLRTDESEYTDKVLKGDKYLAVMIHTCREVNYLIRNRWDLILGTFRLPSIVLHYSLATRQVLTVQSSEQKVYLPPSFGPWFSSQLLLLSIFLSSAWRGYTIEQGYVTEADTQMIFLSSSPAEGTVSPGLAVV